MRPARWFLLLALLLLVGAFGAAAQSDTPPVLTVLASIPDRPESRAWVSYADYAALTGGRATQDAWIESLSSSLISGPDLSYFEDRLADQERLIGVALFDIAQAATWGQPPAPSVLFQGAFDAAAVAEAYAARDYSATPGGDFTLFCGPDGCDAGLTADIRNRNPGDPFGGELGAQRPVLFAPLAATAQLISSPSLEVLTADADAAAGNAPSLADSPDVQAAVRAITGGALWQAHFLNAETFGPTPTGAEPLPPYTLAVLAETDTDEGPVATVTLVFPTLADAEAAASTVESRLDTVVMERSGESFAALLKERGVLFTTQAFEDADTGLGLAQLTFRAADGEGSPYRLLVQALQRQELGWLAILK